MAERPTKSAAELGNQSWCRLADAVRRFEQAWRSGSNPELAQFLPPGGDPLRERVLVELIKVDQEYRWQAGQPQGLEAYLTQWPELRREPETMIELVEAECLTRACHQAMPAREELGARFPDLAPRIDLAAVAARARQEQASAHLGASAPVQADTSREQQERTPSEGCVPLPATVGRRFGRYEIRQQLGRGGMGTVYRAYDTHLEREVALKIPQLDLMADEVVRERFLREARSAAAIRHRNVCPIYDAGQIDGTYYIAMALIEGRSLAAWMEDRTIDPRQAAELVAKLARALEAVHAAGVLHRDVKPSNVMTDASGEPLLMDFGLARQTESRSRLTDSGSFLGTPAYMSPEQADGKPADARSDVYGLGLMLYQMLTGRLPFSGPPAKLLHNIVHAPPPKPGRLRPDLDPRLEQICLKAMAKVPGTRYQTAGQLAEALEQHLESAAPPSRGRRLAWLGAAGAAAILLLGVIICVKTNKGTLVLEVDPPDVSVTIDGNQVHVKSPRDEIWLTVGKHQLEVTKDGFQTCTDSFTIRRGATVELSCRLEPTTSRVTRDTPGPDAAQKPEKPPKGRAIMLTFDAPVPGTIKDKNGVGTGFTHRLPGTGAEIQQSDPQLALDVDQGALRFAACFANLSTFFNMDTLSAPGLLVRDVGTRDLCVAATFRDIRLVRVSTHLLLYAGPSPEQNVKAGFHRSGPDERPQYIFCAHNGGWHQEHNHFLETGKWSNGDTVRLALRRRNGQWQLSWHNQSNGDRGECQPFTLEWLRHTDDLYVGIYYSDTSRRAAPPDQLTSLVEDFSVVIGDEAAPKPSETGGLLYTFRSANPQPMESFGFSVSVTGDAIIVGAPAAYTNAIPGAVYVFDKATRAHRATLGLNEAALGSRFGIAVAGVGNDVLVGAYRAAGGGAAYLYDGLNGYSLKLSIPNPNPADPNAGFGGTVAAIGDKMLVVAVHEEGDRGAVYLFDKAGTLLHTFHPTIGGWKNFGKFVAPMGTNKVLIGAHLEGCAYFFEDDGTDWKLKWSIPAASGPYYGFSGTTLGSKGIVTSWSATHIYDLSRTTNPPQLVATIPVGGFVAVVDDDILIAPHGGNVAYLYDGATYQQLLQISPPGAGVSPAIGGVRKDIFTGDGLIGPRGVIDQSGAVYLFQGLNQKPDADASPIRRQKTRGI